MTQKRTPRRREREKLRREQAKEFVRQLKTATPCTDCGIRYPHYIMQFDHLRDKCGQISKLVKGGCLSTVKAEIAKCEIVCANCHAARTHQRGEVVRRANAFTGKQTAEDVQSLGVN